MNNEDISHKAESRIEKHSAETKKKSDEIQLFRQALQRQNDRASEMRMPDDMEQRVMKRIKSKSASSRWRHTASISAIAAGLLLLIGFFLFMKNGKSGSEESVVAQQNERQDSTVKIEAKEPMPINAEEKPVVAQNNNVQQSAEIAKQPVKENETISVVSSDDRLNYYISQLEAEMEAVDDSVREAHLEKLIAADFRLQQLVNRIVKDETEQAMKELQKDSTANYINF